jgi:hypothetical protein
MYDKDIMGIPGYHQELVGFVSKHKPNGPQFPAKFKGKRHRGHRGPKFDSIPFGHGSNSARTPERCV